jgi:hypothetical protein
MLLSWFTEVRNRQQSSGILVDAEIAPLVDTSTPTALRERIEQQATEKVAHLEHVGTLYTDLIPFWKSKLSEVRHQTTSKDIKIARRSVAYPLAQSAPHRTTISRPVGLQNLLIHHQKVPSRP